MFPHFCVRINSRKCLIMYNVLIYFTFFIGFSFALNCRTESGPKEGELKNIYMTCLRKQDSKNSSHRVYSDDGWKEPRGHNQRSQWNRDRDDRMNERDDRMNSRDERMNNRDERMNNRDDRMNSRGDRMSSKDDRLSSRDDRMSDRDDRYRDQMNGREDRMNRDQRMGGRDERMNMDRILGNPMGRNDMPNTGFGRSDLSSRDDFPLNEDFGSFSGQQMPYNSYRSTPQPRRYKREKRVEINSGQRSQYNPNHPQRSSHEDSNKNDERNSNENNSSRSKDNMDKKACALHCFLENMEMTGDDGMPDRYLVTHAITKDVKDEDLKDFLQESIEECFQILDNESTEDKCEFSKNLMMCLSEKGRANCNDWKDDFQLQF